MSKTKAWILATHGTKAIMKLRAIRGGMISVNQFDNADVDTPKYRIHRLINRRVDTRFCKGR